MRPKWVRHLDVMMSSMLARGCFKRSWRLRHGNGNDKAASQWYHRHIKLWKRVNYLEGTLHDTTPTRRDHPSGPRSLP